MTDIDLSKLTRVEQIKKIDDNTVIKYKVIEEKIDLESLRKEMSDLEEGIKTISSQIIDISPNISSKEKTIIENHNFQILQIINGMRDKIEEIKKILNN